MKRKGADWRPSLFRLIETPSQSLQPASDPAAVHTQVPPAFARAAEDVEGRAIVTEIQKFDRDFIHELEESRLLDEAIAVHRWRIGDQRGSWRRAHHLEELAAKAWYGDRVQW